LRFGCEFGVGLFRPAVPSSAGSALGPVRLLPAGFHLVGPIVRRLRQVSFGNCSPRHPCGGHCLCFRLILHAQVSGFIFRATNHVRPSRRRLHACVDNHAGVCSLCALCRHRRRPCGVRRNMLIDREIHKFSVICFATIVVSSLWHATHRHADRITGSI
jgi:hypothetical protein